MYDAQIGRWHVPDPLTEQEYNNEVDNAIKEEVGQEEIEDKEETFADIKKSVNQVFQILRPISLTAENSAVHYSESPYAYVWNNPINFIDPLGLDTVPSKTLPPVILPPRGKGPSFPTVGVIFMGTGGPF